MINNISLEEFEKLYPDVDERPFITGDCYINGEQHINYIDMCCCGIKVNKNNYAEHLLCNVHSMPIASPLPPELQEQKERLMHANAAIEKDICDNVVSLPSKWFGDDFNNEGE